VHEETLRQLVGEPVGEALARPEHRGEGLTESCGFTRGHTKVVELGEVERP
jgi:hypothetical protein